MLAYMRRRKETALAILEKQLVNGTKPYSRKHQPYGKQPLCDDQGEPIFKTNIDPKTKEPVFILDAAGQKIPELMENYPLTESDKARITKEINTFKTKLKGGSIL